MIAIVSEYGLLVAPASRGRFSNTWQRAGETPALQKRV